MQGDEREPTSEVAQHRSRRAYLAGAATLAAVAIAGCSGGGDGPEATVRSYVNALDSADIAAANDHVHPAAEGVEIPEDQAEFFEDAEFSIESLELIEEGEETAQVDVTITATVMGEEQTTSGTVYLEKHEGEWKIVEVPN